MCFVASPETACGFVLNFTVCWIWSSRHVEKLRVMEGLSPPDPCAAEVAPRYRQSSTGLVVLRAMLPRRQCLKAQKKPKEKQGVGRHCDDFGPKACWHLCARPQTVASALPSSSAEHGRGYPRPAPLRPNLLQPGLDVLSGCSADLSSARVLHCGPYPRRPTKTSSRKGTTPSSS